MKNKRAYVVNYTRGDDGWWVATVQGVAGCLTQGKSIEQTRTRIREALSLFVDDAQTADLIDNVKLPKQIEASVSAYRTTKKKAEQIEVQQKRTAQTAAFVLKEFGFSTRDAAAIMDLSHQRVNQIGGAAAAAGKGVVSKSTGKSRSVTNSKNTRKPGKKRSASK